MEFQQNYIKECFQAFQYSTFINKIVENLETNQSANVRSYMDVAIDELQEQINQPIGSGEETIHNARVSQLNSMYKCWYKLFALLEEEDEPRTEILRAGQAE
jgi:type II secretory pathway predicted ATPase ExeA